MKEDFENRINNLKQAHMNELDKVKYEYEQENK